MGELTGRSGSSNIRSEDFYQDIYSKVLVTSGRDYGLGEWKLILKSRSDLDTSLLVEGLPNMCEALRTVSNPNTT